MKEAPDCEMLLLTQADFDGELDAAQAAAVATHRAGCPHCQAAYAMLTASRQQMRTLAPEPVLAALRELLTVKSKAPGVLSPRRTEPLFRGPIATFIAGAGLAAAISALLLWPAQDSSLVAQVVAGHVRALQPGHLEDVLSTDRHTVKPWFDGRIDFAPPVKDLAAQGFPLEGGRLDYLADRAVAALVYGHGKHPIDLFVWPDRGTGDRAAQQSGRNGYNTIHWVQNGMALWAVSDLEADQLADFVRLWRAAP